MRNVLSPNSGCDTRQDTHIFVPHDNVVRPGQPPEEAKNKRTYRAITVGGIPT